jgi:2-polyprenyl-3-methyl-5-hydroxy-6-metoxy-1,4-benzoquinol methylase
MTTSWEHVDTGWGRQAVAFAYLFENLHWREYLSLLEQTGVGPGTRYLDIACGAGLALQLACVRGAQGTWLDASPRLLAIAAARTPTVWKVLAYVLRLNCRLNKYMIGCKRGWTLGRKYGTTTSLSVVSTS